MQTIGSSAVEHASLSGDRSASSLSPSTVEASGRVHPQTVRTELDPVDDRLEQISQSDIGQPATASRLCRKRSASAMMREYRPMAARFVERGLADPV